ncbi:hypothetical protein [Bradyrhizobium sp. AUGA SZCCT0431]|uniref:hypothetical protein n=1 Tax=Bradyrhizobium sp. AUGA SZCCT0431 TaxID=2807674 RepID=UPI001BA49837|nr:hypothetical protein [Bradyrhizobium sp. AUGA SZCCT0431]MBR1143684.1 hypothetical protein [Bradyrhizobium sp. AUGA SZCCT0431]
MDKLREIFAFVCFAMGICALVLAVFQAWNGKVISAGALGLAFAVCGIVLYLSQIKTLKVWQVEVELRETLDRAEEIIGRVRKLAAISARASYLTIAWGNRMGVPTANERQAVLDDIDAQLSDLKVTSDERAVIVRPWVGMVRADFFFMFTRVVRGFATLKASDLTAKVHANQSQEANAASMAHSDLITPWSKKNDNFKAIERLENKGLSTVISEYMPDKGGWLSDKELAAFEVLKQKIVKLNDDSEKKGGYTKEASDYYDKHFEHEKDMAKELWELSRQ